MKSLSLKYGFLLLLVISVWTAYAQEVDYNLKEVLVKADLQKYYQEDTRREMLDSALMAKSTFVNLGELLREHGGIVVSSYGSRGSLSGIRIRGTGDNHTRFLWNGIPVNSLTTGSMDASLIPAAFMESISITRGASGVMAGNSSFGGAIYLENDADWTRGNEASLISEAGSHGYRAIMPSIRLSSKRIQYKANFQLLRSDNNYPFHDVYKPGSPQTRQVNDSLALWGLMQNLFVRLKANTEINIGSWLQAKNKDIPPVMGSYQAAYANQVDRSNKNFIKLTRSFGGSRLLLQAAYLLDSLHYTKLDSDSPGSYLINSHITTRNITSRAEWRWFVNQRFTLDLGAHSEHPRAVVDAYGSEKIENRGSIIAAAKYRNGSWIANLGLRKEFNPYNPPKPLASFGMSWKSKDRKNMIRGNISNKFRIPTFNERYWQPGGSPDLLPEYGWGGELAWRWMKSNEGIVSFEIEPILFYQQIWNWIQWVPGEGYWLPQNQDRMISRGAELTGSAVMKIKRTRLKWTCNYSFTDAVEMESDTPEKRSSVIYVPKNQAVTSLSLIRNSFSAGVNYQFSGRRFTTKDQDPLFALDEIHLVNIHASVKRKLKNVEMKFYMQVNNLFNHQYQMIRSYASPGISGVAGLQVKFTKNKS